MCLKKQSGHKIPMQARWKPPAHTLPLQRAVFSAVFSELLLPYPTLEILKAVPKNQQRSSLVVRRHGESWFLGAPWGTTL